MKIAVVTGASSGLGKEFVWQLSQEEPVDEIWAIARRMERLQILHTEMEFPIRPISLDLTRPADLERYQLLLSQEQPEVRVLVNASGYAKFGDYRAVPLEESLGMFDLNCKAVVAMTELTLPYMTPGARILEIASIAAFQPLPYLNTYAATKAFVLSYSRGLNRELKPRKITVTAVCPGWMQTEFFARAETSGKVIMYYDCFHEPTAVVEKALDDSKKGRDVSVHGGRTRLQRLLVKLLPHRLVMWIWECQQHFPMP